MWVLRLSQRWILEVIIGRILILTLGSLLLTSTPETVNQTNKAYSHLSGSANSKGGSTSTYPLPVDSHLAGTMLAVLGIYDQKLGYFVKAV